MGHMRSVPLNVYGNNQDDRSVRVATGGCLVYLLVKKYRTNVEAEKPDSLKLFDHWCLRPAALGIEDAGEWKLSISSVSHFLHQGHTDSAETMTVDVCRERYQSR